MTVLLYHSTTEAFQEQTLVFDPIATGNPKFLGTYLKATQKDESFQSICKEFDKMFQSIIKEIHKHSKTVSEEFTNHSNAAREINHFTAPS